MKVISQIHMRFPWTSLCDLFSWNLPHKKIKVWAECQWHECDTCSNIFLVCLFTLPVTCWVICLTFKYDVMISRNHSTGYGWITCQTSRLFIHDVGKAFNKTTCFFSNLLHLLALWNQLEVNWKFHKLNRARKRDLNFGFWFVKALDRFSKLYTSLFDIQFSNSKYLP